MKLSLASLLWANFRFTLFELDACLDLAVATFGCANHLRQRRLRCTFS